MNRLLLAALLALGAATAGAQSPASAPPSQVPATAANAAPATAPAGANPEEFAKAVFFGRKFFDLKDYASAYDQFAKADALQPDTSAVLYDMALTLAKAGRYSEAQTRVDRYLQLFPAGPERPLATKLQLELDFQRELQKKRQADESYLDLFNRGKFLYGKNDLEGALKKFQEAEQQRPNDPAPVFDQGVVYDRLGDLTKAAERFHRYAELEADTDLKAGIGQRLIALEAEIDDMRTKIVCPFCGLRLPIGATWCPRCWHGPYLTSSAVWNSRPCTEGASATRATYYADGRFAKNDALPCMFGSGTMLESIRYTPARQRAIQQARKSEGWTYNGEIIQGIGNTVVYSQGPDYLEHVISPPTGEMLSFAAHKTSDGAWLLDREETIIDGQKYTSKYTFDASNRVAQQQVDYQNATACNHLITMTADFVYQKEGPASVKIHGGYDGYPAEGSPRVDWDAAATWTYDAAGRLAKEDLAVTSFAKTYTQKPVGAWRDEVGKMYPSMRARRPIEAMLRSGDYCATNGTLLVGNMIDLRPFYTLSPNLTMQLPFGVTHATVTFTYPEAYKVP